MGMTTLLYSPTLFTALAYYIIGGLLIYYAIKVWTTHPINRVFIFGDYLTAEGVRLVMAMWPLVILFGLFIFSCAAEHHIHWLWSHGWERSRWVLLFMGWIEAVISLITAAVLVFLATR